MSVNKVILVGRTTKDVDLRSTGSGSSVANFTIATNRVYKDKDGNKQESVEFSRCVAFGKSAETIGKYVKKATLLFVEGRLQTRSWEDTAGVKHWTTEVIIESFRFLGSKSDNSYTDKEPDYSGGDATPDDGSSDVPF